ncbi:2-polyprenyl-3-methyl-6-methoxy-1,4-benzoquinone monooxygenase [Usitatibacter palustris]|uniref:3-demethoxyubiquinol 3-hydroxylase n=1 Tax=Usitatibacter palustris TaxID=2732487 RepID=A0A6M4H6W0_9PROT|nr:2-polyprenyl-3-methyl-6-methoxy-1,4-benzoquinone monooxygenase [Usitatibacter palustris]QJR13697.1 3-demethoxyubiquinol 3-hydroxylase [Usitatibacter palustris]
MSTSLADRVLIAADAALRTLAGVTAGSRRSPATTAEAGPDDAARRHSAGLMRVNHSGEICAQALYSGQAIMARDDGVRAALQRAASEERDHLAWCRGRLEELESRPSLLDPLWYAGSFALGVASGMAGDRWSLGFLVETEKQVEHHLDEHLDRLPPGDHRSREILEQMRLDEIAHGASGEALGAQALPLPVKLAMKAASRVMTRSAYWV